MKRLGLILKRVIRRLPFERETAALNIGRLRAEMRGPGVYVIKGTGMDSASAAPNAVVIVNKGDRSAAHCDTTAEFRAAQGGEAGAESVAQRSR